MRSLLTVQRSLRDLTDQQYWTTVQRLLNSGEFDALPTDQKKKMEADGARRLGMPSYDERLNKNWAKPSGAYDPLARMRAQRYGQDTPKPKLKTKLKRKKRKRDVHSQS